MVGCLGDLFKSVESLNPKYFQSEHNKDSLLNPKYASNVPLFSLTNIPSKIYKCGICGDSVSNRKGIMCPGCYNVIVSEIPNPSPSDDSLGGSVKEVVTYMVMDNLQVKPIVSTIFRINHNASIVDLYVQVGLKEGLAILKASLETTAVLTSVFLEKMVQ